MSDTLLAILHMCIFPGGAFALIVGFLFKGLDRRVEARLQRRLGDERLLGEELGRVQPGLDERRPHAALEARFHAGHRR